MASQGEEHVPPAEDTAVVDLGDEPTMSDEDWPVSDLYRVEPAEDGPAEDSEPVAPAATKTTLTSEEAAPAALPTRSRRQFPPDIGTGGLLAIAGAVGVIILVALLLGLRQDDPASARTSTTSATAPEQVPTTPAAGSPQITLRELKGMLVGEARPLLEKQGLRVQVRRIESDRPRGEVLTQQPPAGTDVASGDVVSLVASGGKPSQSTLDASATVRVPGVVGLSASEAASAIRDAGLRPRIRPVTSSQAAGTVIDQSPGENASLPRDSEVRLDIAKARPEPARVEVPNAVGSTASAARRQLRSAGFTVTVVSVESEEPVGTVVSQSPGAGAELREGSEVTLRVSSGPANVDVPDVTGLDESSATAQLESAGFQVRVTDESTTDPLQDGMVVRQSPQGGSTAAKGALIALTVARLG